MKHVKAFLETAYVRQQRGLDADITIPTVAVAHSLTPLHYWPGIVLLVDDHTSRRLPALVS